MNNGDTQDFSTNKEYTRRVSRKYEIRKKNRNRRVIVVVAALLLLAVGFLGVKGMGLLNQFEDRQVTINEENIGISDTTFTSKNIINIMLFGIDDRKDGTKPRSDSMMILTIDKKLGKIKLTSLMRDSYVEIDGHGKTKLNHAYAYGGPELALNTINSNFNMNISKFVTVDYYEMEKIVDSIGGITLDIKDEEELEEINNYTHDVAVLGGKEPIYLEGTGTQKLNGMQAVAYSRIRYVGNGDYERTERQRRVLSAMFDKLTDTSVLEMPSVASKLMPLVTTNLTTKDILSLGSYVVTKGIGDIEQQRFPLNTYSLGKTIKGTWYLDLDLESTAEQLHDYVYNDIIPEENNKKPFK